MLVGVRPQKGGEDDDQQGEGERAAAHETESQCRGSQEEECGNEARKNERQAEGLIDTRERLGPQRGDEQGEVPPAGAALEHAVEDPQDERRQGCHLVGELAEVVHAVREEGIDHAGKEARQHAARDGVGEQIREGAARHQGGDDEQVDDEQWGSAHRHQRSGQETDEELRLLVRDRVRIGVVEREIVNTQRIVQDLAGVPGDDARLHHEVAAIAAQDGRRQVKHERIGIHGGDGEVEEHDERAVP